MAYNNNNYLAIKRTIKRS